MVEGSWRNSVIGGPASGFREGQGARAREEGILVPQVDAALLRRVARGRHHQIEVPKGITGMLGGRKGDEGLKDTDAVVRGQVDRADNEGLV